MRPTEIGEMMFKLAHSNNVEPGENMPGGLQDTLNYVIQGLGAMNTGLRATYMKLEQIEALIKAQQARRP